MKKTFIKAVKCLSLIITQLTLFGIGLMILSLYKNFIGIDATVGAIYTFSIAITSITITTSLIDIKEDDKK